MCGISIFIHRSKQANCYCLLNYDKSEESRIKLLKNRGPDSFDFKLLSFTGVDVLFQATVLHLRGHGLVTQPLIGTVSGNMLLWNGEIFGGIEVSSEQNDASILLSLLDECSNEQDVLNVLCKIQGPWALIFYFKRTMQVFFGRDILGRRSLLWTKTIASAGCDQIIISSVGNTSSDLCAIPATGVFSMNLFDEENKIVLHPWTHSISGNAMQSVAFPFPVTASWSISSTIENKLSRANPQTDPGYIDFENIVKEVGDKKEMLFEKISKHMVIQKHVALFLDVLEASVKRRVSMSLWCVVCNSTSICIHRTVAILFSGGLDCSVLAALTDKCLEIDIPIDLINVSFEHSVVINTHKNAKRQQHQNTFNSPDRISALKSYEELRNLSPNRCWNFVEVNVSKKELQQHRIDRIQPLVLPHQTVLDDSIGCALWFASRGCGKIKQGTEEIANYTSPARIVLLGMGADEQLGGYSRHRNVFQKDGWNGLSSEIKLEIDRISERNLSRDDRIISDSGREGRYPYLDENVVSFLNTLPIWIKTYLLLPRGVGEKLLLRAAAHQLGLTFAAALPKRAIQFGSRIAHLEAKDEKGSDLCRRLHSVQV